MSSMKGSTIHDRIRELIPNLPKIISAEALDKLCKDDSVERFLIWFYENVKRDNILTYEYIELKKHIQQKGKWLQKIKLDMVLTEKVVNCPELLKLIELVCWNCNQTYVEYNIQKELHDLDYEYLKLVENSTDQFKKWEEQLDNNLEIENDNSEKEKITVKLTNENCLAVLQEFDSSHRQFSEAVEFLASTFTSAIRDVNKKKSCLWTQMPIELYIKQTESYNDYLSVYANRQFFTSEKNGSKVDINNLDFSSELSKNNKIMQCKENLLLSKINEIVAKIEYFVSNGIVNYASEIFNEGNLRVPNTPVMVRADITELMKSRDFLEENINQLQGKKLANLIKQFFQTKIVKVLQREAETRLKSRQERLSKLERLCTLAKEYGYAFATLLCMLFELQVHKINEIVQFVIDARHYISKEYSLSLLRNEHMEESQNEHSTILESAKSQNSFSQTFIDMISLDTKVNFGTFIQYYDELKVDNHIKLHILFYEKLINILDKLKNIDTQVMKLYDNETNQSPTLTFSEIPFAVLNEMNETSKQVELLENNAESMKRRLKNMIKETNSSNLEREKLLIWQKFLAEPQFLSARLEELEYLGERYGY